MEDKTKQRDERTSGGKTEKKPDAIRLVVPDARRPASKEFNFLSKAKSCFSSPFVKNICYICTVGAFVAVPIVAIFGGAHIRTSKETPPIVFVYQ